MELPFHTGISKGHPALQEGFKESLSTYGFEGFRIVTIQYQKL